MAFPFSIDDIKFDERGLVPVILQDVDSGRVLMAAWANQEAMRLTLTEKRAWFWSRSRGELWLKGATSGNIQEVVGASLDCDADTVLLQVRPRGPACHTGSFSCFGDLDEEPGPGVLREIYRVILDRKEKNPPGSYVAGLLARGEDAILKKIGEETTEVLLASRGGAAGDLVWEISDLWFHTLVLLGEKGIPVEDLFRELARRRK